MTLANEPPAPHLPEGTEILTGTGIPEAAALLALVQPTLSADQWRQHLHDLAGSQGHVCGFREQGRLTGLITVAPMAFSWLGAWRQGASVTGLAILPGPGAAGRIRSLVKAGASLVRQAGGMVLQAEASPWAVPAGFVPQAPSPYWSLAPETVRRFLRAAPLRPATEADLPAMAALYERRALALAGALRRQPEDWQRLWAMRSPAGPLHLFTTVSDGTCGGYVVLRGGDSTSNRVAVSIDEWLDDGGDGLPAVVSFLSQLQGRAMVMEIPVPPDRPFAAWLTQPAPVTAQFQFGPCMMVVDPALAVSIAMGEVPVELSAGRVQLTLAGGMMSLAEPVLSALVAGSLDARTAWHQGDLTGDEAACQAFADRWPTQPCFRFPLVGRRYP
jgi:hypothetical protein